MNNDRVYDVSPLIDNIFDTGKNIDLKFSCKHCDQPYWMSNLKIAALFYGIFFLIGEKVKYIGFKCPKCLKILLLKCDEDMFSSILKHFSYPIPAQSNNKIPAPSVALKIFLSYHSTPNYFTKDDSNLKDFDILTWENFEVMHESFDEKPHLYMDDFESVTKDYLCSYIYRWNLPTKGSVFIVFWYREEEIEDLVKVENEKKLKIFPRYFDRTNIFKAIDEFCWDLHQERIYIVNELGEKAYYSERPNIKINKIDVAYNFLKILTASPDFPYQELKIKDPFLGRDVPKEVEINYLTTFAKSERDLTYENMANEVWNNFINKQIHELLYMLAYRFTAKYMKLSQTNDFSYGAVWDLKKQYLKKLNSSITSRYQQSKAKKQAFKEQRKEIEEIEEEVPALKEIITENYEINQLKIKIYGASKKLGKTKSSLLLLGESGTGKELFARAIHHASGRPKHRFVVADCGAQTETLFESELFGHVKGAFTNGNQSRAGAFELANGGAIFLDEIGNIPLNLQQKLLRVLGERQIQRVGSNEMKEIDVIVILATNKNLDQMVADGEFMPDLYQRFKRPQTSIPPLRDRKDDIPKLVEHFIKKYDEKRQSNPKLNAMGISDDCMDQLMRYDWKDGNVRELAKVIEEIFVFRSDDDRQDVAASDLPREILQIKKNSKKESKTNKKDSLGLDERDHKIIELMTKLNGNKSAVARELNIDRKTITRRINDHSLNRFF